MRGKHSPSYKVPPTETSTHLVSTCTMHRRAAAILLDQSELDGGSVAEANTCMCLAGRQAHSARVLIRNFMAAALQRQNTILQVPGRCGKHSPSECRRQRRART